MDVSEKLFSLQNYTPVRSLFKNEQNEIILAKRNSDNRNVVLKQSVLQNENIARVSKLAHEYEILKKLDHHGIPKVFDILYDGEKVTLVQEYIDGSDLKGLIFNRKINHSLVLNIAFQLSDILHYIHFHDVIHKDINPGNLMLDKNGTLKLIDFGISSTLHSETSEILKVEFIEGTLTYIAPEQTGRTSYSITKSSDFYSTGILLYELLTGKTPFDSVDPLEVIHFHLSRNPIPLKKIIPDIPQGLDQIVAKLMEKNPDERYQNASGLKADLLTVKNCFEQKKPLSEFRAGLNDNSEQYRQSQKLYGRENEINELLDIYKNINRVKAMLVMVAGYSGVGKSALIRHIKYPIIQNNGTFISGKFDQFKKDIPYYGFIEAIHGFIKNLLSEPEEKIKNWQNRILTALGENAGLITEVIPLLTKIIGVQPPVPKLQPAEQESRFHMVLIDFIYVFSSPGSPLVIFLDDLQWADLPSLNLMVRLLENYKQDSILLLGAYRDNEVEKGHPLLLTLKQINELQGCSKEIKLQPLNLETTCKITADSFGITHEKAQELGEHIYEKTKGNPFFIHNFLRSLYNKKLVIKEPGKEWTWDRKKIAKLNYTDNVIDLMTESLTNLPESTTSVLKLASILGNTFSLSDLANISEQPQSIVFTDLLSALKGGFIVANSKRYRDFVLSTVTEDFDKYYNSENSIKFTFAHDRIQQAAYNLTSKKELVHLHLKIGRLLMQSMNEAQIQEDIFELANHFTLSYQLIEKQLEKDQIAELCLVAGKKAKDSTSYSLAASFLNVAKELLGENSWLNNYQLTYKVLFELGECEYLNNNSELAENYFKEVLAHSKTRFEKLQVYYLHSSLYLKMGNTNESLRLGLEAAKMYNIHLPKNKVAIQLSTLLTMSKYLFLFSTRYKNPESVFNLKDCNDEEIIALNKFLIDLATSAYQQDQNLMMLVIFRIIRYYLSDGFTDASGWGFSGFSVVALSVLKLQKRGFNLWDITIKLHQRTNSPLIKWRLSYTVLCFHNHWRIPFRQGYNAMVETLKACVLNGDQIFTGYTAALLIRVKLMAGEPLTEILENSEDHISLLKNSRGGLDFYLGFLQTAKSLHGLTQKDNWNDDTFNGADFQGHLVKEDNKTKLAFFYTSKVFHLYYQEQYRDALKESEILLNYSNNFPGDICEVIQAFYTSMTIATIFSELNRDEQKQYLKQFKKHLSNLKLWAKGCNANYGAFYQLMLAEYNLLQNNGEKALNHYLKSMQLAAENRIKNVEAIAYERAATHCLNIGLEEQGQEYIKNAYLHFSNWGATTKCNLIAEKYPFVLTSNAYTTEQTVSGTVTITSVSGRNAIDLASIVKASQTIASQVKYEDVLKNLMHITIENAGAEKGCLLLYKEDNLCIEAIGISGNEEIEIQQSIPFENSNQLPKSVVNYCKRTEETIVLHDAFSDERFKSDSYVLKNVTHSILCLPITAVGNIKGFLYLENNLLKGVFNNDRIELLQMLSGQIGISIENSILYENLEEKVKERTREIEKTLAELKSAQAQLIQSEKMASLGELTAGIAHEIQNPLNFVNNFSEVSADLIQELTDELKENNMEEVGEISNMLKENLEKINFHGKRASSIVKGMLEHSRTGTGIKEPTDMNKLADEYLRLSFHGFRAKDKSFNADFKLETDPDLPKIKVEPQDIGRVLLNLINNAFYTVNEKVKQSENSFKALVVIQTKRFEFPSGNVGVEIRIKDNGSGIPENIKQKIFQPFFTTKPTGQGTGLGLSLSFDIITKGHGGNLNVESQEGEGTTFIIQIP
ncbi:MAG: AAA family ATPase [Draconibacterium sp.]